jgi:RNA polymerase sigma-70 factor (ECF subfamily)
LFVYKRVGDQQVSADITSIVFHKALEKLHLFRFTGIPFKAWLYRVAANETNLFFRKTKSRRAVFLDQEQLMPLIPQKDEREHEQEEWKNYWTRQIIECLQELEPRELDIIELRYFQGHSMKETAFILDISISNAKVKSHRVIKKLRQLIALKGGEPL